MGGSSTTNSIRRKARPTQSGGGSDDCPVKLRAVITSPASGIGPGTWLEVKLDRTSSPPRVVLFDLAAGTVVGSLTGIPNLDVLIRCLEDGVDYRAYTDAVSGGRIDVTIVKQ